jgi:hypothetical protein
MFNVQREDWKKWSFMRSSTRVCPHHHRDEVRAKAVISNSRHSSFLGLVCRLLVCQLSPQRLSSACQLHLVLSFFVFLHRMLEGWVDIARLDCVYCDNLSSTKRLYDRLGQIKRRKEAWSGKKVPTCCRGMRVALQIAQVHQVLAIASL